MFRDQNELANASHFLAREERGGGQVAKCWDIFPFLQIFRFGFEFVLCYVSGYIAAFRTCVCFLATMFSGLFLGGGVGGGMKM